ncbi:MAG: hypothetical protein QNJ12_06550 [Ilumatobacter sp.]|uniref:hypothetical protein n=1 Tax=Ilumatobacter sp. TaxID=1967498 RepID=UPI00261BCA90|nr:hypothetical protein [Ilumatobacter sp.]MDJ0768434.1 hypothetical protein [Ilumatobacter sp.]
MRRGVSVALMVAAVVVVPIGFFVDAAGDQHRDSNLGMIAVADLVIGLVFVACFLPAISMASRARRIGLTTGAVIGVVIVTHLSGWLAATRTDAGAQVLIVYLVGGVIAALVAGSFAGVISRTRS